MSMRTIFCSVLILSSLMMAPESDAKDPSSPFFWGFAVNGYPVTSGMIKNIEQETRIVPQILVFYLQWPLSAGEKGFPKESLEAIWCNGAFPCLTWEPMYYDGEKEVVIAHERILRGEYDLYIKAFAREARLWGKPLLIRFGHEMNIDRYHWGTEKKDYGPPSPEIYKRMFKYVVNLFRKEGANNVLWVFCPNAESVPNVSFCPKAVWNRVKNYYPGDRFVDVLGMDGYNWGTTQTFEKNGWNSQWKNFKEIFLPVYRELKIISPRKPLFIFETASANEGGGKAVWIKEALDTIKQWNIRGMVWFQANKEVDWRINSGDDFSYVPAVCPETSCSQQWIINFHSKNRR